MREAIVESIREFLFEELSKRYSCTRNSDRQDLSYIDFSDMIRIEVPSEKDSLGPIHVGVKYHAGLERPVVLVYLSTNNMSYKFWDMQVDIAAPNFGKLLEVTVKYIEDAFKEARTPPPMIDD